MNKEILSGQVRLDIGCSNHKLPNYIGVDLSKEDGVDVVADLHNLPFAASSVDIVHTRHTLEHVKEPLVCISELYRICRAGGRIVIIVPHYSNPAYWADVTHLRPFSVRAFEYFDLEFANKAGFPIYLPNVHLRTISAKLIWWPKRLIIRKSFLKRGLIRLIKRIIQPMLNINATISERFLTQIVGGFYEVEFILEPVKESHSPSTK